MRPTKNRVFCVECAKAKMLFESESKAKNFLKFNSEEIEQETGIAPVRVYYCSMCGGWHVTSQKDVRVNAFSRISRIVEANIQTNAVKAENKRNVECWVIQLNEKLSEMLSLIEEKNFEKAMILSIYIKNCFISKPPKGVENDKKGRKALKRYNSLICMLHKEMQDYIEKWNLEDMFVAFNNEVDVAEVLLTCGEREEACEKMLKVKKFLEVLENKYVMKDEREELKIRIFLLESVMK